MAPLTIGGIEDLAELGVWGALGPHERLANLDRHPEGRHAFVDVVAPDLESGPPGHHQLTILEAGGATPPRELARLGKTMIAWCILGTGAYALVERQGRIWTHVMAGLGPEAAQPVESGEGFCLINASVGGICVVRTVIMPDYQEGDLGPVQSGSADRLQERCETLQQFSA